MDKIMAMRLTNEETVLVERAAALEARLGDRGGPAVWARRVVLKEAKRVIESSSGEPPQGT